MMLLLWSWPLFFSFIQMIGTIIVKIGINKIVICPVKNQSLPENLDNDGLPSYTYIMWPVTLFGYIFLTPQPFLHTFLHAVYLKLRL